MRCISSSVPMKTLAQRCETQLFSVHLSKAVNYTNNNYHKSRCTYLYRCAKSKGSICWLHKWADTAFWLRRAMYFTTSSVSNSNILVHCRLNPWSAKIFLYKPWGPKVFFFQLEIIINILVSSFCFISIPMLWVCGNYKKITLSVRRLTLNVRIWRL